MRGFTKKILEIILPATCLVCKTDLHDSPFKSLCPMCVRKIIRINKYDYGCGGCEVVYSAVSFEGIFREIFHAFKFQGRDYLADFMVELLETDLNLELNSLDAIIPVPMSFFREWRRGYNQSTLIAHGLGKRWNVPVRTNVLTRHFFAQGQVGLTRKEREVNAARGFRLKKGPKRESLRSVLLVDDIFTTGSTLRACARLLRHSGVSQVVAITLGFDPINDSN